MRASQGGGAGGRGYGGDGGGISKFGAGNECRRCGQEGHWVCILLIICTFRHDADRTLRRKSVPAEAVLNATTAARQDIW